MYLVLLDLEIGKVIDTYASAMLFCFAVNELRNMWGFLLGLIWVFRWWCVLL